LLGIFREHNGEYKRRIGVNVALSTWRNYNIEYSHLERFIRKKYRISDIHFRQLNHAFIESYEYYLRIDCKMGQGTMVHKIYSLRKMAGIAIVRGIIDSDPFAGHSFERPGPVPGYIPSEEVEKLMNTPMKTGA
jgi:hypothetical protein